MLEKIAELNERLTKADERLEAWIKTVKFDLPGRCGIFAALAVLTLLLFSLFGAEEAQARCSRRVADPLILARFQECNPKAMISYLYNDLVTPYSFNCAKKISATCEAEHCDAPKTAEEDRHCKERYIQVLNACVPELDNAAKMAKCKDTQAWPISVAQAKTTGAPAIVPVTTLITAPVIAPAATLPVTTTPITNAPANSAPPTEIPTLPTNSGTAENPTFGPTIEVLRASQSALLPVYGPPSPGQVY